MWNLQRLVSLKLASKHSYSTAFRHHCRTFKAPTKVFEAHNQNEVLRSPFTRQVHHHSNAWQSPTTFSERVHGFRSESVLVKQFSVHSWNSLYRESSRILADNRVRFQKSQFPKLSFPRDFDFRRSWFRRLTTNDLVLGLIISNVAVFMLWRGANTDFMLRNFTVSLDNIKHGRVHTLITSAFSHMDTGHLISNMIGLYFFGMHIGNIFGPEFLLKLYLAGAVGGSVFYLVHQAFLASSKDRPIWGRDPSRGRALGASGAVNAIMLLDIFLFPKSTLLFEFFIPVPAVLLGIFLIGKDILRIIEGDRQIAGAAHLGGAAVAALTWARIRKGRF